MIKRSKDIWLAGYYLSRFGVGEAPPDRLLVSEWRRAYSLFYRALGDGRTLSTFANSLKNARDSFDAYGSSGRVGWRAEGKSRQPAELPDVAGDILKKWNAYSEQKVWAAIAKFVDLSAASVADNVLTDLFAELEPESQGTKVRTEGGRSAIVTNRIERDPSLRGAALNLHGYRCQVCGFSFEKFYGAWGKEFAIVHHLRMLAENGGEKRETDPQVDLAVLCANCHCMVHRKRHVILTLDELRAKLSCQL